MTDPTIPFTYELQGFATCEGALKWDPHTNTWGLAELQLSYATPHPLETLPEGLQSLGAMLQISLRNWGGAPPESDQGPRGV